MHLEIIKVFYSPTNAQETVLKTAYVRTVLPLVPSQNKQVALTTLQLSRKTHTDGTPPHVQLQPTVDRPPTGTQIYPTASDSAVPHKHRQHHKLPQNHLPATSR